MTAIAYWNIDAISSEPTALFDAFCYVSAARDAGFECNVIDEGCSGFAIEWPAGDPDDAAHAEILAACDFARLTGHDAIEFGAFAQCDVEKFCCPVDSARTVTIDEAEDIAREDPALIYIDATPHA